jgi:predicted O-methyltransferase YrrM
MKNIINRIKESVIHRAKNKALRWTQPLPFNCRHIEYSTISSIDDQTGVPTERLLDISIQAIIEARKIDLSMISSRMKTHSPFLSVWPGEHYKLLAGLIQVLKPKKVIEVGTFAGLSALCMLAGLPPKSNLTTIDIVPWSEIDSTVILSSDFDDGRFQQVLGDLSNRHFFDTFKSELSDCDFLFIDAPKDVIFETTLLMFLETITLKKDVIVVFDDIRQWNMLSIWRDIKRPKLDLTSFGHWSGTGIIDWNG